MVLCRLKRIGGIFLFVPSNKVSVTSGANCRPFDSFYFAILDLLPRLLATAIYASTTADKVTANLSGSDSIVQQN